MQAKPSLTSQEPSLGINDRSDRNGLPFPCILVTLYTVCAHAGAECRGVASRQSRFDLQASGCKRIETAEGAPPHGSRLACLLVTTSRTKCCSHSTRVAARQVCSASSIACCMESWFTTFFASSFNFARSVATSGRTAASAAEIPLHGSGIAADSQADGCRSLEGTSAMTGCQAPAVELFIPPVLRTGAHDIGCFSLNT